MQCSDTGGQMPAIHINTGALEMAQQIQRISNAFLEQNTGGNGEITFRLQVCNGKISRFLQFAGKWFLPRKHSRER